MEAVKSAVISECGQYRYRLERELAGGGGTLAVIMVNPSTADAEKDDPTIRKLIGFGNRNKFNRLIVGNLFAYRAADVRELKSAVNPIGPENDNHLSLILAEADQVICAWGPLAKQPKRFRNRFLNVLGFISAASLYPYRIGPTANDGQPKHPLMLPYALEFERHLFRS